MRKTWLQHLQYIMEKKPKYKCSKNGMRQKTMTSKESVKCLSNIFANRQISPKRCCWLINVWCYASHKIGNNGSNTGCQSYVWDSHCHNHSSQCGKSCHIMCPSSHTK